MDRNYVKNRLEKVLINKLNFKLEPELYDEHLLGNKIGMKPYILVYIFYFVEMEFGIKIGHNYISENRFSTMNNIIDTILEIEQKKQNIH